MLQIDRIRLSKIVDFLQSELKDVENYRDMDFKTYQENAEKRRSVERWIENIVNSSLDLAKIILVSENMQIPDTYREYFIKLYGKGLMSKKFAGNLAEGVKLRNILAHEYVDIKWKNVEAFISEKRKVFENWLDIVKEFLKNKE